MQVTEWFPPSVSPVHEGVYEVLTPYDTTGYRKWDRLNGWYSYYKDYGSAKVSAAEGSVPCAWRGLAKPAIEQTLDRYFNGVQENFLDQIQQSIDNAQRALKNLRGR